MSSNSKSLMSASKNMSPNGLDHTTCGVISATIPYEVFCTVKVFIDPGILMSGSAKPHPMSFRAFFNWWMLKLNQTITCYNTWPYIFITSGSFPSLSLKITTVMSSLRQMFYWLPVYHWSQKFVLYHGQFEFVCGLKIINVLLQFNWAPI